ncbi:hypothetical protein ACJZ2D_012324 [Fusarium nematophilum]
MALPRGAPPFRLLLLLLSLTFFFQGVLSQARCSKDNLCATGCCSKDGFCGTSEAYCGEGCQSTCDFKLGCDAANPCQDGSCCNESGFCGFGPGYCASEICVSNCDAKSECDPGFGSQWAKASECPLNACCSDVGYCGITQEYCGDRKFSKPSCSKDYPVNRVIGYYEGGAAHRSCDRFTPGDIQAGVYTHINFAYAVIDPDTFRISPAFKGDAETYRQLAQLRQSNPDLKLFISVGGWAFNDGSTNDTFSSMVASEAHMRTFITSLVSFMNTYNFDGVDIDWRYPGAAARGGNADDTQNLVGFARNLQMALRTNGQRNGFSMTVPAVYSYLQHFDLQGLSKYVNWFNVLSFDLHGAFNSPDTWINNQLNAHTNLTEISNVMDLIWRSSVPSSKVVMGLAFYSRTFTASDPKCVSKGCPFDSAGELWGCSGELGLVSNAEITRLMTSHNVTSTLDKEAAVKVLAYGDQWITYDDKTTLKLKVDLARSQCMGGVMVWAVNHDTKNGTFSKSLQTVVGSASDKPSNGTQASKRADGDAAGPGTGEGGAGTGDNDGGPGLDTDVSDEIPRDQCRWTNCGQECPSGWQHVRRRDPYYTVAGERMWDDTGCQDQSRRFCCPPGPEPWCQWLFHNRGSCNPECPSGSGVEVGSTSTACGNGLSQLACCQVPSKEDGSDIDAMKIWDHCRWKGKEPDCGLQGSEEDACSEMGDTMHPLISASRGSGATQCYIKYGLFNWFKKPAPQTYCCFQDSSAVRWEECFWNNDALDDGHCRAGCPSPFVKVGLDDKADECKSGSRAYCCKARVVTLPHDDQEAEEYRRKLMESWVDAPTCPVPVDNKSPGSKRVRSTPTDPEEPTTLEKASKRQVSLSEAAFVEQAASTMLSNIVVHIDEEWNDLMTKRWTFVTTDSIREIYWMSEGVKKLVGENIWQAADSVLCQMNQWDDFIGQNGTMTRMACPPENIRDFMPGDFWDKPYDGNPGEDTDDADADAAKLVRRAGGYGDSRSFTRELQGTDWDTESDTYFNGDRLAQHNGDNDRYLMWFNPDDCTYSELRLNEPSNPNSVQGEHPTEEQTVPNFAQWLANGQLEAVDTSSSDPLLRNPAVNVLAPNGLGREIVADYMDNNFAAWQAEGHTQSVIRQMWDVIGSRTNTENMVNAEDTLNQVKARIWGLRGVIGDGRWSTIMRNVGTQYTSIAGTLFHYTFGVFQYLNHANIQLRMRRQNDQMVRILQDFSEPYMDQVEADTGTRPDDPHLDQHWRNFMNQHYERMVARTRAHLEDRIGSLSEAWNDRAVELLGAYLNQGNAGDSTRDIQEAFNVIALLDDLSSRIDTGITLPVVY